MNELAVELGYKNLNNTLRTVVKEMLESGEQSICIQINQTAGSRKYGLKEC